MKRDILDSFSWHSSIGIDVALSGNKQFVTRLSNTASTRKHFVAASGDNFLVHKTTKALWRVSDDDQTIEPVYPTDILSEDEAKEITEEI